MANDGAVPFCPKAKPTKSAVGHATADPYSFYLDAKMKAQEISKLITELVTMREMVNSLGDFVENP